MYNFILTKKVLRQKVTGVLSVIAAFTALRAGAQCDPVPGDQTAYGQEQWIGYVYTDYNTTVSPPADPFSGTYRGYVTKTSDFDFSMGGDPILGENVCGSYADYFAVRFKMQKTLDQGYYRFHIGGDDGYRLSLDGGATFPAAVNVWSDHGYVPADIIYYHAGGTINFVIEYYEATGGASVDFNIHYMDCTSTAPTQITGDDTVLSCSPTTTLTVSGGTLGVGSHYEWGTGNTPGVNQIPGMEGATLTVSPTATTTYWARRMAAYECAGPTSAVFFTVNYQNSTPGDPAVFGDNIWNVYTSQINNNVESYKGYYTDTAISYNSEASFDQWDENPSAADTWNGCPFTGNDNFTYTAKRQGFPCNEYTLSVDKWDDEIWVYINNETTPVFHYNGYSGAAPTVPYPLGTMYLDGNTKITVKVLEGGGATSGYLNIVPKIIAPASVTGTNITCPGNTITLMAQGGATGSNGVYQWGTGPVPGENIISGQATASLTVTATADTTYWVHITKPACSGYTSAAFFTLTIQGNTWIGPANSDWNNASNWSCGAIPTINQPVIIPTASHQPDITTVAYAKTLTVQSAASVTIAAGGTMTIADGLFVDPAATFTVNNNGSLVQVNDAANTGTITAIKNANPLYRLDYTMWSAPVQGQNLQAFSPATSTNRFYEYKYAQNSSNAWIEGYWPVDPATTSFATGKGYLIRMPNSINTVTGYADGNASSTFTGTFSGTPNNGPVNVTLSMLNNRFTAVGNPYPSPVSVADFFAANGTKLAEDTGIYLWRKRNNSEASSYATLTLAGLVINPAIGGGAEQETFYSGGENTWLLAQGQGFIVRTNMAATTAPVLTFTNSMRRAAPGTNQAFFKSAAPAASRLWLNVANATGGAAQTAVAYLANATLGMDYGYDGKLLADANTVALYSLVQDTKLAIQARPQFDVNDVVPMGFTATAAGQYTISLDHVDGVFANGQDIYLKDNTEGIIRNLGDNSYSFTSEAGTFESRFEVLYTTTALGVDNPELAAENVMVYQKDSQVNITSPQPIAAVQVYDLLGRSVFAKTAVNNTDFSTGALSIAHEALIVKVTLTNGSMVTKKIVF